MSTKNLARDVESIALALSEEGGYEYYHIDDDLRELAKDVSDMQAENAKLRELVRDYERCSMHADCDRCEYDGTTSTHCPLSPCFPDADELRELGVNE